MPLPTSGRQRPFQWSWLLIACLAGSSITPAQAKPSAPLPTIPSLAWTPRSDWQSVKTFGALGDGLADDTAAIQKALDAAVDGTVVYFPAGAYRITRTLSLEGPLLGVLVIGHGRDSRIVWDGEDQGRLFRVDGVAYSRFEGLLFAGGNRASVGIYHDSHRRFETEVRHRHLAFLDFTEAGILAEPDDQYALAETSFENCLFENCHRGVKFVSFNDYNYTFDGCEFRGSDIAIECHHGNFYARNCRFERSASVDVLARPEHGSSLRRCVSIDSNRFIEFSNPVAPLTVENCLVSGWRSESGAITLNGAPVTIFDCDFSNPPGPSPPIQVLRADQRLTLSENTFAGTAFLVQPNRNTRLYRIPGGRRSRLPLSTGQSFLKSAVSVPGKIFDAVADFGASADGISDDTIAIQACIDAARAHGDGALAYLPTGDYVLRGTLRLEGENYVVGGSGWQTRFVWKGAADAILLAIHAPQNITLEHIAVRNSSGNAPPQNAIDIQQTGSGEPSHMTYDGVFLYGMYREDPFRKGLLLKGLTRGEIVSMPYIHGNLRVTDSAEATILATIAYEGAVTVEGENPDRDGFLGLLTRLSTQNKHSIYLRNNLGVVVSDLYVEQADHGISFEGSAKDPPGRATIQGAKLALSPLGDRSVENTALTIRDYQGEIFIGPFQYYISPTAVRIDASGEPDLDLYLFSSSFYRTHFNPDDPSTRIRIHLLGNEAMGSTPAIDPADSPGLDLAPFSRALDDLRRLGELDHELNHPR